MSSSVAPSASTSCVSDSALPAYLPNHFLHGTSSDCLPRSVGVVRPGAAFASDSRRVRRVGEALDCRGEVLVRLARSRTGCTHTLHCSGETLVAQSGACRSSIASASHDLSLVLSTLPGFLPVKPRRRRFPGTLGQLRIS